MAMLATMCILVSGCAKRISQATRPADEIVDVNEYQWQNRIVMVFTKSEHVAEYTDFMDAWSQANEGVKDRDLLLFRVFLEGTSQGPRGTLTSAQAKDLRKRFTTGSKQHGIVLIGKDGGVKLRSNEASVEQIFELIDAMPMRRAEMCDREDRQPD